MYNKTVYLPVRFAGVESSQVSQMTVNISAESDLQLIQAGNPLWVRSVARIAHKSVYNYKKQFNILYRHTIIACIV